MEGAAKQGEGGGTGGAGGRVFAAWLDCRLSIFLGGVTLGMEGSQRSVEREVAQGGQVGVCCLHAEDEDCRC